MTEPRAPRFDRAQLLKSYGFYFLLLFIPTALLLNTVYGALLFPLYLVVFVLSVSSYLRNEILDRSRGLAGLLGCGTVLLFLIPLAIALYVTQ